MHKIDSSMTSGPLTAKMLIYTVPIILTGILQLFFTAADLVIVGQFGESGSNAIAAVGCTGAVSNLFINFFIGCSAGSGVAVAHAIGAQNRSETQKTVHTIVPFSVIGGFIVSVVGVALAKPMLVLMATPTDILDLSVVYMRIVFCGMVPNMVYNFGSSVLRAAGDSKGPLYFLIISGVLNVALNLIFVIVFHMDVAGVALATVISQAVSAYLVIRALMKRSDDCKLILRNIRIYKEPLKRILRLGVPAGVQSCLFSLSNIIIQSSINSLSTIYAGLVAGNAAANNLQNFAFMTNEGFKQTAMNFAGQNSGSKKFDRVKSVTFISLGWCTAISIVVGVLMTAFSRPLLGIYITDSPEAVEWGVVRMIYMCLPFFVGGIMDIATGILRGMGYSVFPMLASIFGVCVFRVVWIFTIFQIPEYHTPQCLFISYIISWALTFLIEFISLMVILNKKIKNQKDFAVLNN